MSNLYYSINNLTWVPWRYHGFTPASPPRTIDPRQRLGAGPVHTVPRLTVPPPAYPVTTATPALPAPVPCSLGAPTPPPPVMLVLPSPPRATTAPHLLGSPLAPPPPRQSPPPLAPAATAPRDSPPKDTIVPPVVPTSTVPSSPSPPSPQAGRRHRADTTTRV
jgi:hypothetical protein